MIRRFGTYGHLCLEGLLDASEALLLTIRHPSEWNPSRLAQNLEAGATQQVAIAVMRAAKHHALLQNRRVTEPTQGQRRNVYNIGKMRRPNKRHLKDILLPNPKWCMRCAASLVLKPLLEPPIKAGVVDLFSG